MRNNSIDTLKFFCAFLVICIHTGYSSFVVTRCAVPVFFMISGYYLYSEDYIVAKRRIAKSFRKVLLLFLFGVGIYSAMRIAHHNSLELGTYASLWDFLFYNALPIAGHLWYIAAYIYVLVIMFFVSRFNLWTYLFYITPFLLFLNLAVGKYSVVLTGNDYPLIYTQNYLLTGLPFFLLGSMFKRYRQVSNKLMLITGGVISLLAGILENRCLDIYDVNGTGNVYISTIALSIFVFLTAISIQLSKPNLFSVIGRRDSAYIYVLHIAVISLFSASGVALNRANFPLFEPIVIMCCTILIISGFRGIKTLLIGVVR